MRLSTFGRVRGADFTLLATFDRPHFTLVLADLSELTLTRLDRCFDDRSRTRAERPAGSVAMTEGRHRVAATYDLAVDFMDMTNDLRLWARPAHLRPRFEPSVRRHVVVGDED
ncbi:MAG: hypothetical protein ACRD07_18375, partial [Acidimicrobiales bacterium]